MTNSAGSARLNLDKALALRDPGERERTGLFVAEGVRFVNRAIAEGADIRGLITCRELLWNPLGQRLAGELKTPRIEVSKDEFAALSILGEPQGIAVVVRQSWRSLPPPRKIDRELWIGVDALRLPGNLGTAIRTAHAAGARGLISIGDADPFDPRSVRASMGSIFSIDIVRANANELRRWVDRTGTRVVGADGNCSRDYRQVSYRGPTIVMLGEERRGLSEHQREICHCSVSIPMAPGIDSLNVSAAGAVLLYEAFSQRNPLKRKRR